LGAGDWCATEDLPGHSLVADAWRTVLGSLTLTLCRPGADAASWSVAAAYLRQGLDHLCKCWPDPMVPRRPFSSLATLGTLMTHMTLMTPVSPFDP
jgi:hypothetical protein